MNVLLVDDHPMACMFLSEVLAKAFHGAGVHVEKSLAGALAFAHRAKRLDLVLLDLTLPDCAGIATLTRFHGKFPDLRVVIVSADDDKASIRGALCSGAAGYVPKGSTPETIADALKMVAAGGTYVPLDFLDGIPLRVRAPRSQETPQAAVEFGLTSREAEVLRLVLRGLTNRQIAEHLGVEHDTVKQHASAIYRSMGVSSRAALIVKAVRCGIKLD